MQLYYDSDCGICSAFVTWIAKYYKKERRALTATPYSAINETNNMNGIDLTYADFGVQLVDTENNVFRGSEAIRILLIQIPSLKLIGRTMGLPGCRYICAIGYRAIASNRRHLSKWLGLGFCRRP